MHARPDLKGPGPTSLDVTGAQLIRIDEKAIWRLAGGVVVCVTRRGQAAAATREVQFARWPSRACPLYAFWACGSR